MNNDITAQDILALISEQSKPKSTHAGLGTSIDINNPAEMYSNSELNRNKKGNKKENTFQQSTVNVRGQAPIFIATPAQAPLMKEDLEIPADRERPITEPKYGRKLNWQNDNIIEIRLQLGNFKLGNRYQRASAYLSIKTEDDKRYMIFMRSQITTALDETFRGIKKDGDAILQRVAEDLYVNHRNDNLFMGRVMYKVTKGQKIQKHHRERLPQTLLAFWEEDDRFYARFTLVGTDYYFELSTDLSSTQKQYYAFEGLWTCEGVTMSMEDAFGG